MPSDKKYAIEKVLLAFADLSEERGPTIRELKAHVGMGSTMTAQSYIDRMWESGLIEPIALKGDHSYASRGFRLTPQGKALAKKLRS